MPVFSTPEKVYPTPEDAARGDIPREYARAPAVALSPDGLHAAVLLVTNEEPFVEPYMVVCDRTDEGWLSGHGNGGLGGGWTRTSALSDLKDYGVITLSGAVPQGVEAVIVRWRSAEQTVPVSRGYYFYATWDVPGSESGELPEMVAFGQTS